MQQYYALDSELRFKFLSPQHLTALALIIILNIIIYLCRNRIHSKLRQGIRFLLAISLILLEILLELWDFLWGIWSVQHSLPLELCSISLLLTAIMLFTKSKQLYELVYFWGMGGASQAILTPELYYGFPHFVFLQFFIAHGLIITGCLWMTFVEGYRPNFQSLIKAFGITNLYALLIGVFNWLAGSNYLFLCRKPTNPSLLDHLGQWPWYLVSLEGVALVLFILVALPFMLPQPKHHQIQHRM